MSMKERQYLSQKKMNLANFKVLLIKIQVQFTFQQMKISNLFMKKVKNDLLNFFNYYFYLKMEH